MITEETRAKLSKAQKEYCKKYRSTKIPHEETKRRKREYILGIRLEMLKTLGNKCVRCGFDDKRALQVDHINGGGSAERKLGKTTGYYYRNVTDSFIAGENKYQLLCANCNWIKRNENKEFRWEKR